MSKRPAEFDLAGRPVVRKPGAPIIAQRPEGVVKQPGRGDAEGGPACATNRADCHPPTAHRCRAQTIRRQLSDTAAASHIAGPRLPMLMYKDGEPLRELRNFYSFEQGQPSVSVEVSRQLCTCCCFGLDFELLQLLLQLHAHWLESCCQMRDAGRAALPRCCYHATLHTHSHMCRRSASQRTA